MRFSERIGLVNVREVIQTESLDTETRNALWNLISPFLRSTEDFPKCTAYRDIWSQFFHKAVDTVPSNKGLYESNNDSYYRFFRQSFMQGEWYACLDFIEYLATCPECNEWLNQTYDQWIHRFQISVPSPHAYNKVFEQYLVGYRFVNDTLVRITDAAEVAAIEKAVSKSSPSVKEQLDKALRFISDRKNPDYAKSVDCAISAVEAQCRLMLNDAAPTLGKALKKLEDKGLEIHPSLKGAFEKLYGFTSDADGIRHAGLKQSDVDQDLARFMIVTCSAFVNYLLAKEGVMRAKRGVQ